MLHEDNTPNSVTTQSEGQVCVLHDAVCSRVAQLLPLNSAAVITVRMRDLVPPPHDALHCVQAWKDDSTQSVAHGDR